MVGENVQDVFNFVNENFKSYPVMMDGKKEKKRERDIRALWGSIFNNEGGCAEHKVEICKRRFMTLGHKLSNINDAAWKRKKAAIDIQLGNIVCSIYPPQRDAQKPLKHFAFPDYGSIFLRSSVEREAQKAHCNFSPVEATPFLPSNTPLSLHDMFLMFSGEQPFAVRVWPGSRTNLNLGAAPKRSYDEVARNLTSKLEIVPPFSVFVGRGDMLHAGASGLELKTVFSTYKGVREAHRNMASAAFADSENTKWTTRGHIMASNGRYFFDSLFRTPFTTRTRIIVSNMLAL